MSKRQPDMVERARDMDDETILADPHTESERLYVATQWQLMWWKFRKDRLAVVGAVVVILAYLQLIDLRGRSVYFMV